MTYALLEVKYVTNSLRGTFLYWVPIALNFSLLSVRILVKFAVAGQRALNSHVWTNGNRMQSNFRTTRTPLNTPPGVDGGAGRIGFSGSGAYSNGGFASHHPGGANFAFGDGHVEFVTDSIDLVSYTMMSCRADEGNPDLCAGGGGNSGGNTGGF